MQDAQQFLHSSNSGGTYFNGCNNCPFLGIKLALFCLQFAGYSDITCLALTEGYGHVHASMITVYVSIQFFHQGGISCPRVNVVGHKIEGPGLNPLLNLR